jgi:hypothetical protein
LVRRVLAIACATVVISLLSGLVSGGVGAAVAAGTTSGAAVSAACRPVVAMLQREVVASEADGSGETQATTSLGSRVRVLEAGAPSCRAALAAAATVLADGENPMRQARGFAGPIGWLWNNVYYRIFEGSVANMVLFGTPLFIAPLVLVGAFGAVLGGTRGTRRRPEVPDAIRTQVN